MGALPIYVGEMKILVVGSGGREHALVETLRRSSREPEILCAPGNAGIAQEARVKPISADTLPGVQAIVELGKAERVDLVVIGPEAPLVLGLANALESAGIKVFGPRKEAARLEGSKAFTKEFLARHSIPTAAFHVFEEVAAARAHVEHVPLPVVLKADGLAAGKGVIVARTRTEALAAVETILVEKRFGEAGSRLVVEEFLPGSELSLLIVTDGESFVALETAQDYKPVFDGDQGPNTGGMGCYSPYYRLDDPVIQLALERIVRPTLKGLSKDGIQFRGLLYVGLMLTARGPEVLEFNVRFGDPETQVILSRLQSDLVELFERTIEGRLQGYKPVWDARHSVCVVATSGGYPDRHKTGLEIQGLHEAAATNVRIFHGATTLAPDGRVLTAGGRVLGVTALGETREEARDQAYSAMKKLHFEGIHYRRDIGSRGRYTARGQ